MAPPGSQWAPRRELQNAKFESYKLSFDDDDEEEHRLCRIKLASSGPLPGRTLHSTPSELRLGYKEARNRAKWNHLAPGPDGTAGWIDGEGTFWLVDLKASDSSPIPVITLPQPIGGAAASTSSVPADYPVARHLHDKLWALSDGQGRIYTVDTANKSLRASYEYISDSQALVPFRLLAVRIQGDDTLAVLSSTLSAQTSAPSNATSTSSRNTEASKRFQVAFVRFPYSRTADDAIPLQAVATFYGSDLPSYVSLTGDRCCLGSSSAYKSTHASEQAPSLTTPETTDEYEVVSTPRAGVEPQVFGDVASSGAPSTMPPPYSWNQQSDSLTIVFAVPSAVAAKDIKVVFRPTVVSLLVTSQAQADATVPLPKLVSAKLWDVIDAGISTWTYERTGGEKGKYGILSLHLEKKNEDTRWPHVFKQDDNPELNKSHLDVEETLDRSELLKITEAMEKFTKDASSADGGLQGGIEQRSSLLGDEIDMDVDAPEGSEGRGVIFTWVDIADAASPTITEYTRPEMVDLTSLPLPTASAPLPTPLDASVVVKHDVDGLLFGPSEENAGWIHTSTYPALSFVLASKRDVVQVYHYQDQVCIALEAGAPVGSQESVARGSYSAMQTTRMNAYLYYPPPPGSKAKTAKQKVVGLADPSAGAVLGAIALRGESSKIDVAVLCEREIVLLKDVLLQ